MIIIFQCFGGTHTSVAAASIYLGRLPRERAPRLAELLALPYFDRSDSAGIGDLHYAGRDGRENPVFILGSRRWGAQLRALAALLLQAAGAGAPEVAVIDCLAAVSLPVRAGGFLSRRLGCIAAGRPLVGLGIIRSYPRLLELVQRFEQDPAPYLLRVT